MLRKAPLRAPKDGSGPGSRSPKASFGKAKPSPEDAASAVSALIGKLKGVGVSSSYHGGWSDRNAAASSLGNLGDSRAVLPLIEALNYKYVDYQGLDLSLRIEVAKALGKLGDTRATPSLINAMEYDGMGYDGARLREAAAGALGKIKDANAIRPLISKLGDREEFVCQAIKKTLLKFGEPAVLPLIEALRKERDSSTRMDRERIRRFRAEMAIIGILGELKDPRAVVPLVEVFGHSTFSESNAASEALRKIGVTPPESCIPRLISASHTNNGGAGSSAESYAENALVMIGGAAVLPLITELKGGPHSRAAAEVLTRISPAPDESQIPGLISALPWLGREVDAFVQSQLEKIGEPAVIPLIDALRSGDAEVRGNAAKALARIKDSRAVLPIINLLGEDSSPSARAAAAMALGEFGDSRAVGPLIAALKDTGGVGHVDSYAAKSLAKLKDERAVLPLIEALHGEARAEAARALGELGDARAIRPLLNLIEECGTGCDFSQLRGTARAAIDKIQGR